MCKIWAFINFLAEEQKLLAKQPTYVSKRLRWRLLARCGVCCAAKKEKAYPNLIGQASPYLNN
jgi:hypothetical protein